MTQPGIEPQSTASVADAISTRPQIEMVYGQTLYTIRTVKLTEQGGVVKLGFTVIANCVINVMRARSEPPYKVKYIEGEFSFDTKRHC